jgi:hypothetical protein
MQTLKKLSQITLAIGIVSHLAGCAPQMAPMLVMPEMPITKTDTVLINLQSEQKKTLNENVVQMPNHQVLAGSSLVINVPDTHFSNNRKNTANDTYKTKDFFNQAEQQIERVLIGSGFRVISRSKLEAKLRDLRDAARCSSLDYNCLHGKLSNDMRPILEDAKRKWEKGELTEKEYTDKARELYEKATNTSAGRTREDGQKELTDISEVIRAAQSGEVRADYILQINNFETDKDIYLTSDLRHYPQVREFINTYPALASLINNQNMIVSCAVIGAELNAQLIHVQTGEIIWIGNHELTEWSSGADGVSIELGQRTYPENYNQIKSYVDAENSPEARLFRAANKTSPNIPSIVMKTDLTPSIVTRGHCDKQARADDEVRSQLTRAVARELMETIKVSVNKP